MAWESHVLGICSCKQRMAQTGARNPVHPQLARATSTSRPSSTRTCNIHFQSPPDVLPPSSTIASPHAAPSTKFQSVAKQRPYPCVSTGPLPRLARLARVALTLGPTPGSLQITLVRALTWPVLRHGPTHARLCADQPSASSLLALAARRQQESTNKSCSRDQAPLLGSCCNY